MLMSRSWQGSYERIGGTEEEKRLFFDEALAPYGDVYWVEGCEAPTVRSKMVHFNPVWVRIQAKLKLIRKRKFQTAQDIVQNLADFQK